MRSRSAAIAFAAVLATLPAAAAPQARPDGSAQAVISWDLSLYAPIPPRPAVVPPPPPEPAAVPARLVNLADRAGFEESALVAVFDGATIRPLKPLPAESNLVPGFSFVQFEVSGDRRISAAVTPLEGAPSRVRIEVYERAARKWTLLDTEAEVPAGFSRSDALAFDLRDSEGRAVYLLVRPSRSPESMRDAGALRRAAFEAGAEQASPPEKITSVKPVYPPEAKERRIQGTVMVSAKIDEEGRVIDAIVLKSIPALNHAALEAVRRWTFKPVVVDGRAKRIVFTVPVVFVLK